MSIKASFPDQPASFAAAKRHAGLNAETLLKAAFGTISGGEYR